MPVNKVPDAGTARVGDVDIFYERFGDPAAPPLMLIAGLGDQLLMWPESLCRRFVARGFQVIRFDNRDVGLSTKLAEAGEPSWLPLIWAALRGRPAPVPYTLKDMAADTVGVLDALDLRSAHVSGASLGGMIAQVLAVYHPERVLSATLMMTTMFKPLWPLPKPRVLALLRMPGPGREAYVRYMVRLMHVVHGRGYPLDEAALREDAGRYYDRSGEAEGALRQAAAIVASVRDLRRDAPRIALPTLVIHGRDDPLIRAVHGRHLAEVVPGAELKVIDGMGHELPEGAWPTVVDTIAGFAASASG